MSQLGAVERRALPGALDEPRDCELAIPSLAPLVLRDGAQHRPGLLDDTPLLRVGQRHRASTSNSASTRVDDFCACWPPGPLDRDTRSSISEIGNRTERVTRSTRSGTGRAGTSVLREPPSGLRLVDSRSMACILLDIDGVSRVSAEPNTGLPTPSPSCGARATSSRSVTNNSTRPRARLAEELREMGFDGSRTPSCRRRRALRRAS